MYANLMHVKPFKISENDPKINRTFIQWRAMIYLEQINDFKVEAFTNSDFFYLHMGMFDQVSAFKIQNETKK